LDHDGLAMAALSRNYELRRRSRSNVEDPVIVLRPGLAAIPQIKSIREAHSCHASSTKEIHKSFFCRNAN
jgi:hypothetical protein